MEIKSSSYIASVANFRDIDTDEEPEIAFLGRSNVGKSSLINALCNKKKLAFTSSKPGKTICINYYLINDAFYFVDLPGYGFAKRSLEQRDNFGKMIEDYLYNCPNLMMCFLLIDARVLTSDYDLLMFNFLKSLNKNIYLIVTKTDKLSGNERKNITKQIKDFYGLRDDHIVLSSSVLKNGLEDIKAILEKEFN